MAKVTIIKRRLTLADSPHLRATDALGLTGMAKALDEQRQAQTTFEPLGFEDRLGLLVDREAATATPSA